MLFVFYMLFIFIIMLNVIIAIINNSFNIIHEKKAIEFRTERGSMLSEVLPTRKPYSSDRWLQVLVPPSSEICDNRKEEDKKKMAEEAWIEDPKKAESFNAEVTPKKEKREEIECKRYEPSGGESTAKYVLTLSDVGSGSGSLGLVPAYIELDTKSHGGVLHFEVANMAQHPHLKFLDSHMGLLSTGQLSRSMQLPVRTSPMNPSMLHISPRAKSFAIAYPVGGVDHLDDPIRSYLADADSSFRFLLFGGVVFMDSSHEIINVFAFTWGGPEMTLEDRRPWNPQYTKILHRQRRFHRTTVNELRHKGAYFFTWLYPGEVLEDDGQKWTDWPFGAFLYLCHKDPMESKERCVSQDCYFRVTSDCKFGKTVAI